MPPHLRLASDPTEVRERPSTPSRIRVVLADAHALVRNSLRDLLDREEDIDVVAEADDLASAVRHVHASRPHVLGFGLETRDPSGTNTIRELRERVPLTQIVVMTMHDSHLFAQRALASGALGFVLKQYADAELPQAVRAAAGGERYVSPRVAGRLDA